MGVVAGVSLARAPDHAAAGIPIPGAHRPGPRVNRGQVVQFCEAAAPFADDLVAVAAKLELTTPARQAAFLAQVAHESNGFKAVRENLNYGLEGLRKTFPKYFPDDASAVPYVRQAEKIASRVYAGRMGNGNEASRDGWRYRGRGLIQVTGRSNYHDCSFWLFGDSKLLLNPELLEQPRFACESAGWYWASRELNRLADAGDLQGITKKINGGLHGFDDHDRSDLDSRVDWHLRALQILGAK